MTIFGKICSTLYSLFYKCVLSTNELIYDRAPPLFLAQGSPPFPSNIFSPLPSPLLSCSVSPCYAQGCNYLIHSLLTREKTYQSKENKQCYVFLFVCVCVCVCLCVCVPFPINPKKKITIKVCLSK